MQKQYYRVAKAMHSDLGKVRFQGPPPSLVNGKADLHIPRWRSSRAYLKQFKKTMQEAYKLMAPVLHTRYSWLLRNVAAANACGHHNTRVMCASLLVALIC